jgi:hypothetical protein
MTNLSDSLKRRLQWKILQTNGLTLTHPLGYLLERQSPQPVFPLSCEIARRLKRNGVLHSGWSRGWVVRAIDVDSDAAKGLIVSRLIRIDHKDALISDRRDYESISLAPKSWWRIVGKVLWWTGRAK